MRANWGMSGLPTNFQFSADGKKLYFLADTSGSGAEIHYVTVSDDDSLAQLEWTPLLSSNEKMASSSTEGLSKEEALRRERMRASLGLHTFTLQPSTGLILVPASPTWFIYNTENASDSPAITELKSPNSGSRIDAKLSSNGSFVSFIRDDDLWVQSVASLEETRITFANDGRFNPSGGAGHRASGVAEYCMQEEFDRYTGYWWSPVVEDGKQRMLYVNVDETHVTTYYIPTPGIRGEVDSFVYPLAGDENAHFSLSIAELTSDSKGGNVKTVLKHLNPPLKQRFPWCEYIPRLGWAPNGKSIWVQLLDRQQQHSVLISIELDQFTLEQPEEEASLWKQPSNLNNKLAVPWDPSSPLMNGISLLHSEVTNLWINVTDIMHWYSDGTDRVIIASELCGPQDSNASTSTSEGKGSNKMRHLYLLTPETKYSYSRKAITEGETWQVDTNMLIVDEKRELVYYMGTKDSPLEAHLYVSSTAGGIEPSKNVQRLTPAGCFHSVSISNDCSTFVTCYSNTKEPHRVQIFRMNYRVDVTNGKALFPPSAGLSCTLSRPITQSKPSFEVNPPELFNFKNAHGETVYGCYYKPRHFDPSRAYPTIVKVYGGPHVQYVSNDYKMTRLFLNLQLYAHLGYLVVIIDGVGSWRRGLKFEGYLRNCMGTMEVQEQVDGLTHLIKSGIVDPERIAVTGWSYGGYLSLLCLAQRPDFFKLAISGAPVTKWEAYDTAYTERYMDTPQNNPDGYNKGSVFHYVSSLPSEPNRLLIIHGNLDENVHICNTFELIQTLITHNKPYQLQVFPNERHGVRDPTSAKYQEMTSLRFFLEHL
jgi:dipeptidyl-peptidase 9